MNDDTWLVMPVVNPSMCRKHIGSWKARGYKIALWQDRVRFDVPEAEHIIHVSDQYPGYAFAVNWIIKHVIPRDVGLIVLAGEDMRPDQTHSLDQIRDMFFERFPNGYGVMQPTGDDLPGTDRICGSPFIGTPFARDWNMGTGPLWSGYNHFFADEELRVITKQYDLLYQNHDLVHYHDHWTRRGPDAKPEHHAPLQARWEHDKALFHFRKDKGFPGHASLRTSLQPI